MDKPGALVQALLQVSKGSRLNTSALDCASAPRSRLRQRLPLTGTWKSRADHSACALNVAFQSIGGAFSLEAFVAS